MLRFVAVDIENNEYNIENIKSFQLSKNISAACDGLRLYFYCDAFLGEIEKVYVYDDEKIIFNGFADTQRSIADSQGKSVFIYARSSACLLIDNEAKPYTYNYPSALSLFFDNALPFDFECQLPNLYCKEQYVVSKGTTCFGAINDFVCGITGKNMLINANNQIIVPTTDLKVFLNGYNILSEKQVINRGNPVSQIDYKTETSVGYNHHISSKFFSEKRIYRGKKMNISSLPPWQKDYTVKNNIYALANDYMTIELLIDGNHNFDLYSLVNYDSKSFGKIENYCINNAEIINDQQGKRTKLILNKNIDLKEITYVD